MPPFKLIALTMGQPDRLPSRKSIAEGRIKTPPSQPRRRTDPYQAPYFFPSPASPDAIDYVQKVRAERIARTPAGSPSRSPRRQQSTVSTSSSQRPSLERQDGSRSPYKSKKEIVRRRCLVQLKKHVDDREDDIF
ncbi:hypothetical protein K474DRAFT_1659793 [Panus rudis PR-1116 ss-1]|nr:hypothetical protein K474DRAFT_1659793 [Panus rudis PR-1116 ss-1]